jgi:hypothetical protein
MIVDVSIGPGSTLNVDGVNNYSQSGGITTVAGTLNATTFTMNGGTLRGTGTIEAAVTMTGGMLVPGLLQPIPGVTPQTQGLLTINGNFTKYGGISDDLIGSTSRGGNGLLQVNGGVSLDSNSANLDISLANGFTLAPGDTFDIINYFFNSGLTGGFRMRPPRALSRTNRRWAISPEN